MLEVLAALGGILSGIVIPAVGVAIWLLRNMVKAEMEKGRRLITCDVVPKLSNDETSVASYAKQARDMATKAVELAEMSDARVSRMEIKLDTHILASEHYESLALRR